MSDNKSREEVIRTVKSKGYWEIHIYPETYEEHRIEKVRLKEIVRAAKISLRGWDYPHFLGSEGEPYYTSKGIDKHTFWMNHIEFWRLTESGNFYNLLALKEDWMGEIPSIGTYPFWKRKLDKKWLGVCGALYVLTEIFLFTKRLAQQDVFGNVAVIDIKLHDLINRRLDVDDSDSGFFLFDVDDWTARDNQPWHFKKTFDIPELLEKAREHAFTAYRDLILRFNWDEPPINSLKSYQEKFLKGII